MLWTSISISWDYFFPGGTAGEEKLSPLSCFICWARHAGYGNTGNTHKVWKLRNTYKVRLITTGTNKHRHWTGTQKHIQSTFNIETHTKYIWPQKQNHRNTKTNTKYANTETQQSVVTQKHTKIICEHRNSRNQDTSLINIILGSKHKKSPKFLYHPSIVKFYTAKSTMTIAHTTKTSRTEPLSSCDRVISLKVCEWVSYKERQWSLTSSAFVSAGRLYQI